jgi:hypothetical protein
MKAVRANVMLPQSLVREIDRVAGARGRSAFLAEAAQDRLARLRFKRAASRAFGAWRDERHPDLVTDADLSRYLKRLRASSVHRVRRRAGR